MWPVDDGEFGILMTPTLPLLLSGYEEREKERDVHQVGTVCWYRKMP